MLAFPKLFGDFCLDCDPSNTCDKCKKVSCVFLSYKQAEAFINAMKEKGFTVKRPVKKKPKSSSKKRGARSMSDLPSQGQTNKIHLLANDIRWVKGVKLGLQGFCKRMLGVPWPQTKADASSLIEFLKKMQKNQGGE